MLIFRHAKTARGKRVLDSREPQAVEFAKKAVFLRNSKVSPVISSVIADLYALKRPEATLLSKKNSIYPFDGTASEASLEFLMKKNDSALSILASHSKKRPNNMIITRTFDHHVLDMIELSVVDFKSIQDIKGPTCAVGLKPAFIFNGELFAQKPEYKLLQNVLLDFYAGHQVDNINLAGLESVVSVTALEDRVLFRVYRIFLKKSGTRTPKIELQLMGPSIDWKVGRVRQASPEMMKEALRKPKELTAKKEKNIEKTALGETLGRVHMGDQKLDTIQTRKMKALKKRRLDSGEAAATEEVSGDESDE